MRYQLLFAMQKTVLFVLIGMLLSACFEQSKTYKELQAKLDSLSNISEIYTSELSETDSLVAAVLTNFQDINSAENLIHIKPGQEISASQKSRIRDNISLINDKLKASTEALNTLNQKLEASRTDNRHLKHTIRALKKDLELQKKRIALLTDELQSKDIAIQNLDSLVIRLSSDIERLNELSSQQVRNLSSQELELNRVRYCIGTKTDLKDYKLLHKGEVVTETADLNYFTLADQRKLSQIALHSHKAKLLTTHPESSYELIPDKSKSLILNIKDYKNFWSVSRILVIQVD